MILDLPGGPNVIKEVPIRRLEGQSRRQDGSRGWREAREGDTSQGMQAASRSLKRERSRVSPRASRRSQVYQHRDFSPVRLISDFKPPEP